MHIISLFSVFLLAIIKLCMLCKKKMCPGGTDSPSVAKFAYSHKRKQERYFNEKRAVTLEATR